MGVVPYDKAVRESLIRREPVVFSHPKSKPAVAYKRIVSSLVGIEYNEKIEKGFFSKLFRR